MALSTRQDNINTVEVSNNTLNTVPNHMFGNGYENSLSFSPTNINIMSSFRGSEYTSTISEAIKKHYDGYNLKHKPTISVFDKQIHHNFAYSAIVISLENTGIVSYYTILLEATGRDSLRASEIMEEYNNGSKHPYISATIYTADDAMDKTLNDTIAKSLKQEYPNITEFRSVDGVVVHTQADITTVPTILSALAYNACTIENALETGTAGDLNIKNALDKAPNKTFNIESFINKTPSLNELGDVVRTDWKLFLNISDVSTKFTSLNAQNTKQPIISTGGFIDAIPEEHQFPSINGQHTINKIRLRPQIVITTCSPVSNIAYPTLGFTLLGIVISLVMTQKNMWLAAMRPLDSKNNVGALNVLTNIENSKNGGSIMDLSKKEYSTDVVYSNISSMFTGEPIICFDVASYGPQSFYSSALSVGAGNNNKRMDALRYLIDRASWLTSGLFPSDFSPNDIFANEGIVIPMGTWNDAKGVERDIREIDATFIASQTNGNIEFLRSWAISNIPKSQSSIDPFMTKINIIEKLVPDAKITGKAIRVTFNSKFIYALEKAVIECGLNIKYQPAIQYTENSNFTILNSYLQNAGLSNAGNFAHTAINNGPNYSTSYSNVGMNRWH